MFLLHFSVALAQTQQASQPPQPWPPLAEMAPRAPHDAFRSALMPRMDGQQPPKQADVFFGGVKGVYGPQSTPLFRR